MADKISATITSKGQITLPAQHRKAWGLKPGDQIAFDPPGGDGSHRAAAEAEHLLRDLEDVINGFRALGRPARRVDMRRRDDRSAEPTSGDGGAQGT